MPNVHYADAMSEALSRLDGLGYERGEQGDLANHGPMGAEALAALGFGEHIGDWVERYKRAVPHHEPPQARFAIDPGDEQDWRGALGSMPRAGDWEALFARELADEPWRRVLARWWPRLLPGLLGGLTHGLIRTAHAVRALGAAEQPGPGAVAELARGLAYWAARHTELPGDPRLDGELHLARAVAALPRPRRQDDDEAPPAGAAPLPGPARRLRRLGAEPEAFAGYADALGSLAPAGAQALLSDMTSTFAGIYLVHHEVPPVPLVHGVTAPAAIRLVLPELPAEQHEASVAAMWQVHVALLLAFTSSGDGEQDSRRLAERGEPEPADRLIAAAAEHGDEHVIKFTEACEREHALRPDPRFRAAVAAAQHRIPRR